MKNIVAGIDVSYRTLDLVIRENGKSQKSRAYDNTIAGHRALINLLDKQKVTHVCLEATGSYHIDIAIALDKQAGTQVMVINPRASKNFAKALMCRNKTDYIDADVLAQYAERMDFVEWVAPSDTAIALRACSRRIAALTQQKARVKNQLHALEVTSQTPDFIIDDVNLSICQFEKQIENLQQHAKRLIKENDEISQLFDLLLSIKGVGEISSVQLLGELLILSSDMSAKQWVAYAGLDPRQNESGTSVNKKTRISKAGIKYLRSALYMPALCAAHKNQHVSAYYQHLIKDNGLSKLQAICGVMRKLLHAINGMFKSVKPFEGHRFYVIPEQKI